MNPVGTGAFDDETRALIDAVRAPHHEPRDRAPGRGPPHLEYHLYEHDALGADARADARGRGRRRGAAIIGCFYDGGLRELREALTMPVVGMGEASMLLAATLGHRFSIIVGGASGSPR